MRDQEIFSIAIVEGPSTGQVLRTDRKRISVGSAADNDLVLPDPGVLARHFLVLIDQGRWRLHTFSPENVITVDRRWSHPESGRRGAVVTAASTRLLLFPGDIEPRVIEREVSVRAAGPVAPPSADDLALVSEISVAPVEFAWDERAREPKVGLTSMFDETTLPIKSSVLADEARPAVPGPAEPGRPRLADEAEIVRLSMAATIAATRPPDDLREAARLRLLEGRSAPARPVGGGGVVPVANGLAHTAVGALAADLHTEDTRKVHDWSGNEATMPMKAIEAREALSPRRTPIPDAATVTDTSWERAKLRGLEGLATRPGGALKGAGTSVQEPRLLSVPTPSMGTRAFGAEPGRPGPRDGIGLSPILGVDDARTTLDPPPVLEGRIKDMGGGVLIPEVLAEIEITGPMSRPVPRGRREIEPAIAGGTPRASWSEIAAEVGDAKAQSLRERVADERSSVLPPPPDPGSTLSAGAGVCPAGVPGGGAELAGSLMPPAAFDPLADENDLSAVAPGAVGGSGPPPPAPQGRVNAWGDTEVRLARATGSAVARAPERVNAWGDATGRIPGDRGTAEPNARSLIERPQPISEPIKHVISVQELLRRKRDPALTLLHDPDGEYATAIRVLGTKLEENMRTLGYRAYMLTSAEPLTGKTTAAINLAFALAEDTHRRVALIEANFRYPRFASIFGVPEDQGLLPLLEARASIAETVIKISDRNLVVLPTGGRHKNPGEVLSSARFKTLLAELAHTVDIAVIDAPSVKPFADTNLLLPLLDAAVLVIAEERTRATWVADACLQLGVQRVLGALYNRVSGQRLNRLVRDLRDRMRPTSRLGEG